MKKFFLVAIVIALIGLGTTLAGDYYRYDLYDAAINLEQERAGLTQGEGLVGSTKFSFLESDRVEGQESIIMLHGFSGSKTNWLRLAQNLGSDYHLVALDLLGHGGTDQEITRSYSIVEQVKFVESAAASLGIKRFHLVGNSMGGAITSLYAATYPQQVITATLISPAGVHDIPSVMDELLTQGGNPLIPTTIDEFGAVLDFVMEDKPFIPAPVQKVEGERSVADYLGGSRSCDQFQEHRSLCGLNSECNEEGLHRHRPFSHDRSSCSLSRRYDRIYEKHLSRLFYIWCVGS
jgi:pimeloyl-ACP methyl ester carboxylesterase